MADGDTERERKEKDLIGRNEDVNLESIGKRSTPVYADTANARFPLDTRDQVRAAWDALRDPRVAGEYNVEDLEKIRARVREAAGRYGLELG